MLLWVNHTGDDYKQEFEFLCAAADQRGFHRGGVFPDIWEEREK